MSFNNKNNMEGKVALYIATHNITGKKYFGKTTKYFTQEDLQKHYHGSGKYWKDHLKKHGDDVTMELYGIYSLDENAEDYVESIALKFSEENNITQDNEMWANLIPEDGLGNILLDNKNKVVCKLYDEYKKGNSKFIQVSTKKFNNDSNLVGTRTGENQTPNQKNTMQGKTVILDEGKSRVISLQEYYSNEYKHVNSGKVTLINEEGEKFRTSCNLERGNNTHFNSGFVVSKKGRVSVEEFHSNNYEGNRKGMVSCLNKNGETVDVSVEEFHNNEEYIAHNLNKAAMKDKSGNVVFLNVEKLKSQEYEGVHKGKLVCYSLEEKKYVSIPKEDFDKKIHRYSHDSEESRAKRSKTFLEHSRRFNICYKDEILYKNIPTKEVKKLNTGLMKVGVKLGETNRGKSRLNRYNKLHQIGWFSVEL